MLIVDWLGSHHLSLLSPHTPKTIAKGFIVLFHVCIQSTSTIFTLLHPLPLPKLPTLHRTNFNFEIYIIYNIYVNIYMYIYTHTHRLEEKENIPKNSLLAI
jgi:hypothetical protein